MISQDEVGLVDEGYLIKDCSILLKGRSLDSMIVIETSDKSVDHDSLQTVIIDPYTGVESYDELT